MKNHEDIRFTIDDLKKAFQAGRDSADAEIQYEALGIMYAIKTFNQEFDQWFNSSFEKQKNHD